MSELTLVTDFFDLGRGSDMKLDVDIRRTPSRYMEEFKRWARINNPLIVYTDPVSAVEIMDIRRSYGMEDKTTIIPIDDLFGLEPVIYEKMTRISTEDSYLKFRYLPNASSGNPKYDYLWMMKYYFMNDAYNRGLLGENVAWFDFGFDHGGQTYSDENDYNFTWDYDWGGKIHIFCLHDPDTTSCITTLQYLPDCVQGCMYGLPGAMAPGFWHMVREAIESLLMLEVLDDDQLMVLMAYKKYPERFVKHVVSWQMGLKECGAPHMKLQPPKPVVTENKIKRAIRITVRKFIPNKNDPTRIYGQVCQAEAKRVYGRD